MKIRMAPRLFEILKGIVFSTNKETGCALFGVKEDGDFRVLHVIGPGEQCAQLAFHYEADHRYQEDIYNELLQSDPDLCFIGEFHVHPPGMSELSCGDLRTVKKVLKSQEEFVAGIILRKDKCPIKESDMGIHPVYFSRLIPEGESCELIIS